MKKILLCLAVLLALAIGGFALFNGYFYPALGMQGLTKQQHQEAIERAAKGFCASAGLTYQGFAPEPGMVKYRAVESGSEAYTWGAARCLTQDGRQRLVWIYLDWSSKRGLWLRNTSLVLADDDDEILYSPTFPGQLVRAATALSKIMRENARHVREARSAQDDRRS